MIAWIAKIEDRLASFCLAGMSAVIVLQVFMRYVIGIPLVWVDEIAIYFLFGLVYLGASIGVPEDQHFRVGVLVDLLPDRFALVIRTLVRLGWLAFCVTLAWQGAKIIMMLWKVPYISPALGVPQQWPYLLLPIGFALMALKILALIADDWREAAEDRVDGAAR